LRPLKAPAGSSLEAFEIARKAGLEPREGLEGRAADGAVEDKAQSRQEEGEPDEDKEEADEEDEGDDEEGEGWEDEEAEGTKINHQRTELCNISIFGCILLPVHSEVEWVLIFLWNHVFGHEVNTLGDDHNNQPPANRVVHYFYIWKYFASCSFRGEMGMDFFVESCLWARSEYSGRRPQKLTTSEPSCALFLYLEVFYFLFIQK
jgi:hypothetical protein